MLELKREAIYGSVALVAYAIGLFLVAQAAFFASTVTNLRWFVSLQQLWEGNIASRSLFTFMAWAFSKVLPSEASAVEAVALLTFVLLPLPAFYVASKFLGGREAGLTSALLILLYPSYSWLLGSAQYAQLLGTVFLSLGLVVLLVEMPFRNRLLWLAVVSVCASLADPPAGLAFFLATAIVSAMLVKRRGGISLAYAVAAAPALPLFLLMTSQAPTLPDASLPLSLAVLAGILGLYELRAGPRERLVAFISLPVAVVIASVLLRQAAVALAYLPLPMLILSSVVLTSSLKGLYSTKKVGEEEVEVEFDAKKSLSLLLIALVASTSALSTVAATGQLQHASAGFSDRYGDASLVSALGWIQGNTPKDSVMLAEYPLGVWIQSYTGRETLSDLPTSPGDSGSAASYAADTILNANVEVRNSFMRLRDWAPAAPQRDPIFASSNGSGFEDFVYIDEDHAAIQYESGGKTFAPNFYDYANKSLQWVARSDTEAILLYTYNVTNGLVIQKTVSLNQSATATVTYAISSLGPKLDSFTLELWIPKGTQLGFTQVSGNTFHFKTDIGDYLLTFGGSVVGLSFGPDEQWGQLGVVASYAPQDNAVLATVAVTVLDPQPLTWGTDKVVSTTAAELLAAYHVAYLVVPTAVKGDNMDLFGLNFPTFYSQFENDKLTIYKVIIG